jgi:RNA polymerase sigma-70 factor (ECF subfamily)
MMAAQEVLEVGLERHRVALTGYCYRMLGSAFEAEDAVQETFVRAWRGVDRFEGRAPLEAWLYRIATNVCFNLLKGRQRRAHPMDLGPASPASGLLGAPRSAETWVEPIADERVLPAAADPAETTTSRETIRLAFVVALQHLPPRQRAVLILRDVLRWKASEVAELLDTTVVSIKSALQRARATLATTDLASTEPPASDKERRVLLDRYVDAFQRYDIDALIAILHEDATLSMPPHELWLRGVEDIREWWLRETTACRSSLLVPASSNGSPAFAQYRPSGPGRPHEAFAIQVVELSGDRIANIHAFVDPRLFSLFDVPTSL